MKKYEAPEALVLEFQNADLLDDSPTGLIPGNEGTPTELTW